MDFDLTEKQVYSFWSKLVIKWVYNKLKILALNKYKGVTLSHKKVDSYHKIIFEIKKKLINKFKFNLIGDQNSRCLINKII